MASGSSENAAKIDSVVLEIQKKLYKDLLIRQANMKRGSKYCDMNMEPFPNERDRLALPFTDEDRIARKKYLKDQLLSDREPVNVPEWTRVNIFRRLYRKPFDALTDFVRPVIGKENARFFRILVPKLTTGLLLVWLITYRAKYCDNWEKYNKSLTAKVLVKPIIFPGEPGFPNNSRLKKNFGMEGFDERTAFRGEKLVTSGC
ncbi:unnamed protein product [Heterobilharzia americana]|nr:unnamed protein product [Heterobilharzia americana]